MHTTLSSVAPVVTHDTLRGFPASDVTHLHAPVLVGRALLKDKPEKHDDKPTTTEPPSTSTIIAQASSSASVVELIQKSPNGVHDITPKIVEVSAQASASVTANVILGASRVDFFAAAFAMSSVVTQQSSNAPEVAHFAVPTRGFLGGCVLAVGNYLSSVD